MTPSHAPYEVRFTEDSRRNVGALDGSIRKRLRKVLEKKLASEPSHHGSPLTGILAGFWSHHFASHRVIYRIYHDLKIVLVCAVGSRRAGHKTDVYREFEAMVAAGKAARQILEALGALLHPRNK